MQATDERLKEEIKRVLETPQASKLTRRSGLSHQDLRRFAAGELPSRNEFRKLKRFFPHLKAFTLRVDADADKLKSNGSAALNEKRPQIVVSPSPPRRIVKPAEIAVAPMAPQTTPVVPASPLTIKQYTAEQYTVIEAVDPSLAKVLLEGNVINRPLSGSLVDSITRDILNDRWQVSHQGLALASDGRLLDGQHRLHAIIKANREVRIPVTYNVPPEAFSVIDLNGRPRTIADIAALTRGLKSGRLCVAAVKVIHGLTDPPQQSRWTKAEIDELLDKYQSEVSWAVSVVRSNAMRSSSIVGAIAYAYPTDKEKIELFARTLESRVSMTSPMAALLKAAERMLPVSTDNERRDLAHITLRCIWAYLRGEDLKKVYKTENKGEHHAVAYRHFRHLRLKLKLSE